MTAAGRSNGNEQPTWCVVPVTTKDSSKVDKAPNGHGEITANGIHDGQLGQGWHHKPVADSVRRGAVTTDWIGKLTSEYLYAIISHLNVLKLRG